MSDQTLIRLVETLPYFIPECERIRLMEKICESIKPTVRNHYINKYLTWKNYDNEIDLVIKEITTSYNSYNGSVELDAELLSLATWLSLDDIAIAKKILNDYKRKEWILKCKSAILDLEKFKCMCTKLLKTDAIYETHKLFIDIEPIFITIFVDKKEKSFFQKIGDFFK